MEINVSYGLMIQKDDIKEYLNETIKQITDDLNNKVNTYFVDKQIIKDKIEELKDTTEYKYGIKDYSVQEIIDILEGLIGE